MPKRLTTILAALTIPVARAAGLWLRLARPWESERDRAHRLCAACGHTVDEVDAMIDNSRDARLTREEQIELFEATYVDPSKLEGARELCIPCV